MIIPSVSDELHRKLKERAAANHRTVEDEVVCCLQATLEADEDLQHSIPASRWDEIERSVCETIHDRGTPLTDADFQRYREMARGSTRQ